MEEITATTKIRKDYLAAMEAGQFGRLPGGIFPRGFLRAYAQQVGLDGEKVVREYLAITAPEESAEERPQSPRTIPRPGSLPPARSRRRGWASVGVAIAILVALAYWGLGKPKPEPAVPVSALAAEAGAAAAGKAAGTPSLRPAEKAPMHLATAAAPPPLARQLQAPAATASAATLARAGRPSPAAGTASGRFVQNRAAPPAGGAPQPAVPAAAAPAPGPTVQVAITASAPAWIRLSAAGQVVTVTTLAAGQQLSYTLAAPVDLITGNAGATHLTVNGHPQPALGAAGAVLLWEYPPGRVRVLPAAGKPAGTAPAPSRPAGGAKAASRAGIPAGPGRGGRS